MGSSKSGGKVQVVDYRMSQHWGIGLACDALLSITVGEKVAWSGVQTAAGPIQINQSNLFGGNKKEGGMVGTAYWLPGDSAQVLPNNLAARMGLTSLTCPAYRGIASVFFVGATAGKGFLWSSNNPYLRDIWFGVRRAPKGLGDPYEIIDTGDGRKNCNPAAMVYECITNPNFDYPQANAAGIDMASFYSCAQTFINEKFGMSMQWTRQSTIEDFVKEIIDHVQATVYINPRNGLWTMKCIRADYDPATLPELNPDNCIVTKIDRRGWTNTINEIVVTWTDPTNEGSPTISRQNLANLNITGEIVSDSRNYYGIRNSTLATQVADRDLAVVSAPLATFTIEADRSAYAFVPGGCARLNWPEEGIVDLVVRLGPIDYGKAGTPTISFTAVEDIFGRPVGAYSAQPPSQWVDPSAPPEPMDYVRVFTLPAYFEQAAGNTSLTYPDVHAAVLGATTLPDSMEFDLVQETLQPNGSFLGETTTTFPTTSVSFLQADLPAEVISTIVSMGVVTGNTVPFESSFMVIGSTDELHHEIAMIATIDDGGYHIWRGVLDTVPRAWPAGTPVWFVSRDTTFGDFNVLRVDGETARYKLLTRTSRGRLDDELAPITGAVMTGRPHYPNRPAGVQVSGVGFGNPDLGASGSLPATVPVTWTNRNRTYEDNQVLRWDDATVTPEAGQTTTVSVAKTDGTVISTATGLTGTSYALPTTAFATEAFVDVIVSAQRDALSSLQSFAVRCKVSSGAAAVPPTTPPPVIVGGGTDPDPGGGDFRDNNPRLAHEASTR